MATTSTLFNVIIPHLKVGQRVKDWRVLYTAATSTLVEEQKIGYLPCAVDRCQADQKWAAQATHQVSLKAALDELELRLDQKKSRLEAMTEFFNLQPATSIDTRNLSEFFFEALEAGKAAAVAYDVIAVKFFQFLPGGTKLFNKKESLIIAEMTESDLIELFDVVKTVLARKCGDTVKGNEVFHISHDEDSCMPKWAVDLTAQVRALKQAVEDQDTDQCKICGKTNHCEAKCFERICSRCSGKGHDASQCATKSSKQSPSNNTR